MTTRSAGPKKETVQAPAIPDVAALIDGDGGGILSIEGDGDLAKVCDEAEYLLGKSGAPIYQRGGMLVRVVHTGSTPHGVSRDPAAPRIVPFDEISLAETITRHLQVLRRNRKTQQLQRVDCPRSLAQTLLARREWNFPHLEAVVEHPIVLQDGEILWESQYHEPTGLLLSLPDLTFQSPDLLAGKEEAQQTLWRLRELLEEFPFVDELDESVALAFLLSTLVRPVLPTCPAFAFDAHAAGSGKSTLVRTGALMSTGREPAFLTYGDDPAEHRKLLFAALLEGDQQIAIDNVDIPVAGADLAVILTSQVYRGRVLGQSMNASVPTKALISINGNNLQIVGDLTRRVLQCRLDPACERPAEREFLADPIKELRECRSEYVDAALTMMSAYLRSGERVELRPFGSFEDWSRVVRETLVWLGRPDPVDSIRALEDADPERVQLRAMLQAVNDGFGASEFKAAQLLVAAKPGPRQASLDGGASLTEGQAEALHEALQAVCERNGELNAKALGRWLVRVLGRIDGGLRFTRGRQTKVGSMWKVQREQ